MALSLGTNLDDPKTQALLALGLGLLGSRGSFGQSLSDAGQQALGVYNSGRQRQGTEELRALQKRQAEMGLLQAQRAMEEADNIKRTRGSFLDAIDPNAGPAMQPSLVGAMRAGFSPQEAAAFMPSRPESNFAKIDPKDYTPESLAEYVQTGNAAVLRPRTKMEFVDGQAVDPFNVKPGTVIQPRTPANNPWQDLLIPGPNGVPVPNSPLIRAREQIAAAAPGVQVSYGAPVAGMDTAGNPVFFQPDRAGGQPNIVPGVKPPQRDSALTEAQAKAATFMSQMKAAEKELSGITIDPTRIWSQVDVAMAGGLTNFAASPAAQRARQAQEQWSESFLRFKTGAAATKDEVILNVRTFFPQPGDSADVIEQKRRMRQQAVQDIAFAAGQKANAAQQPGGQPEAPLAPKPTKRWNPSKGQFEDVGG